MSKKRKVQIDTERTRRKTNAAKIKIAMNSQLL